MCCQSHPRCSADIQRGGFLAPDSPPTQLCLLAGCLEGDSLLSGVSSRRVIRRALGVGCLLILASSLCLQGKKGEAGPPGVPGLLGQQVTTVFQSSSLATLLSLIKEMTG